MDDFGQGSEHKLRQKVFGDWVDPRIILPSAVTFAGDKNQDLCPPRFTNVQPW
jgi:hypothetical protein